MSAGQHPRVGGNRSIDLPVQFVAQIRVRHWAKIDAGVERVAHLQFAHGGDESLGELGRDRLIKDDAFRRGADLPGVSESAGHPGLHRSFEVGISQRDKRIDTAQFGYALLQRRTGLRSNGRAGTHAAHHVRRVLEQVAVPAEQDRDRGEHRLPVRDVPRHHGQQRA